MAKTKKEKVQPEECREAAEPEEQTAAEEMSGMPPVDVYSLLKYFIGLLGAQAWQWMGILKNPMTGVMEKDLAQAKVAIDTIAVLVAQLENKLDANEQRELRNMLSDLRINFVQQTSRA